RSPDSARRACSRSAAYSAENAADAAEALPARHASSSLVMSLREGSRDATCPPDMEPAVRRRDGSARCALRVRLDPCSSSLRGLLLGDRAVELGPRGGELELGLHQVALGGGDRGLGVGELD